MRKDVTAASRHEHLVLYDPAAIPLDTPVDPDLEAQDPQPLPASAMASLAEQGLAVILRIAHEDCQADIRLVMDEEVEPYIRKRSVLVLDGAILRVPSGKLTVDGVEFLCRLGETRLHSDPQVLEVPAGEYRVQILNLIPWKGRQRAREIEMKTTRFDRIVDRIVTVYTWLGILLFVANVLLVPIAVIIVWLNSGRQEALRLVGAVILIDAFIVAGFWALSFGSRFMPSLRRRTEAELIFDAENPDVVACLRRSADAAPTTVQGVATLAVE
jgi:hypothetical protein